MTIFVTTVCSYTTVHPYSLVLRSCNTHSSRALRALVLVFVRLLLVCGYTRRLLVTPPHAWPGRMGGARGAARGGGGEPPKGWVEGRCNRIPLPEPLKFNPPPTKKLLENEL